MFRLASCGGQRAAHSICADCVSRDFCNGQLADRSGQKCSGYDNNKEYPVFEYMTHDAAGDNRAYYSGVVSDNLPPVLREWGHGAIVGDKASVTHETVLVKARCANMVLRAEYCRLRDTGSPVPLGPGIQLDL